MRNSSSLRDQMVRQYILGRDDQNVVKRYEPALHRLANLQIPQERFENASDVAIYHSEKARELKSQAIHEMRVDRVTWNAVSNGALKLGRALSEKDAFANVRLFHASRSSDMQLTANQYSRFNAFLRSLAHQKAAAFGRTELIVGPIGVTTPGRKQLTLSSALTICLAHVFHTLSMRPSDFPIGAIIEKGAGWDVAADFCQAALGTDEGPGPAKKALSAGKGRLTYAGWSKVTPASKKNTRTRIVMPAVTSDCRCDTTGGFDET